MYGDVSLAFPAHRLRSKPQGNPFIALDMSPNDLVRLALAFYCIGSMDLLGVMQTQGEMDREMWREWIWNQQTSWCAGQF